MAIRVVTEFTRKGTIRIIYYHYDDDGGLADASSVAISLVSPTGALALNAVAMPWKTTGTYEKYYTTAEYYSVGNWQIEVDALDGSYHSIYHSHFNLQAGINES